MTPEEWARIKTVAAGALAVAPDARSGYFAAHCGPDTVLRQEVDSLLAAVDRAEDLFDDPVLRLAAAGEPLDLSTSWLDRAAGDDTQEFDFHGTARYAVRRRIGAGGMGVVYEVEDRDRRQVVALKTLRRWDAADIYRLKQEFRSLADVAHPNLAPLYDLVVDEQHCFFTMALVDGVSLVDYVRAPERPSTRIDRIRHVLPQLIHGVQALHGHGTLHCDLKPSNVLVTAAGHVVILDFGLTAKLAGVRVRDRALTGTPAYLSPEQCLGGPPSEASDWYGVGVTLYEALTGRLPFEGTLDDLLRQKTTTAAPDPRALDAGLPPDLGEVCVGLLHREPAERTLGHEALVRLRGHEGAADGTRTSAARSVFIGRESHLEVLRTAFDQVRAGRHAAVVVHGPSGMGKSALLQHFIEAHTAVDAVVLRSRCHEHESVPYKGLDGVIDGLSGYLSALPRHEAERLLPPDAGALARLFPVLQGLTNTRASAWPASPADLLDPSVIRDRAFDALRELLGRVAGLQPLVVEIDDFHWADVESTAALTRLFRPPEPPALLLLVSFRSDELDAKPFLRTLLDRLDWTTRFTLPLGPLTGSEVERLVDAVWPPDRRVGERDRQAIARESAGNPFLAEQLAHDAARQPGAPHRSLEELLTRRLDRLPPDARAFLDTLAVCGRPMTASRVFEACGLEGDERPLVAQLRAAHLLRGSRTAGRVEMYHDRIRETFAAHVAPDVARGIHERLADILLAHGDDDPEALCEHYRASGRLAAAAEQAAAAATKASAVLAFDRAASYFRQAIDLDGASVRRAEWTAGQAAALENAGRPVEAAEAYLAAARDAREAAPITWRRKAAELFLIGGRIDHGLQVSADVLAAAGVALARGPVTALLSLTLRRQQLRWRGLDFVTRQESQIAEEDRLRIDACWSLAVGLAMVDPIRAADFNVRQLLWALEVGDPFRVARALALEAGFSVIVRAGAGSQWSAELNRRAAELADGTGAYYVDALVSEWAGIAAFLTGRWREATVLCDQALTTLRDHCTGVTWELNLAHGFLLFSLLYRGQLREAAGQLPALLASARDRGNVYLELELGTRMSLVWLAADAPDEAERRANDSFARWSQRGFQRPHYHHLLTLVQTRLYRGQAREAWALLERHRRPLGQTLFRRVQHTRVETANYRARCALALALAGEDATHMRACAAAEARRILREGMPWSDPFARLILAALAYQHGDLPAAAGALTTAIDGFEAADMQLYAAAGRRRLGAVMGGERGRALLDDSDAWMAAQEVRNPSALARLVAPGFPD